ncbi:hypothetical protein [Adonisia turfae]|uniref:hypothetical protein n=1 Tax=Adonisia turfae TaxID=2950184 RepID=UPI0013D7FD06|nr:hypothetical protein [Adonisia turfae]
MGHSLTSCLRTQHFVPVACPLAQSAITGLDQMPGDRAAVALMSRLKPPLIPNQQHSS